VSHQRTKELASVASFAINPVTRTSSVSWSPTSGQDLMGASLFMSDWVAGASPYQWLAMGVGADALLGPSQL